MNNLTSSVTEVIHRPDLPPNFFCIVDIERIFKTYTDKLFDSTAEQLGGLERMCSIALHLSKSGFSRDMFEGRDINTLMDVLTSKQLELLLNFKNCFQCVNLPANFDVVHAEYTYEIKNSHIFASLYLGMAQTNPGFRSYTY